MFTASRSLIIALVVLVLVGGAVVFFGKKAEGPIVNGDSMSSTSPDVSAAPSGSPVTPPVATTPGAMGVPPKITPPSVKPVTPPMTTTKSTVGTPAHELVSPSWFVNTHNDPLTIASFKGKKVVLLEFWTYTNINSRRTIPYLNDWYTKYRDKGLEIIAVHTPEFAFERDQTRVQNMVTDYGMSYPVVLDNTYATWNAYGNKNWPHLYLIDIDGNIAYDHVGEGAYDTTEAKLQDLLKVRAAKLKLNVDLALQIAPPANAITVDLSKIKTGETYLGSARNTTLANGVSQKLGTQSLVAPKDIIANTFVLGGDWMFTSEYASPKTEKATIGIRYTAKRVYFVGASTGGMIRVKVTRDGQPLGAAAGKDITVDQYGQSYMLISTERLYEVVNDPSGYGEHMLEFTIESPGLQAYVIRFG